MKTARSKEELTRLTSREFIKGSVKVADKWPEALQAAKVFLEHYSEAEDE